MLLRRESAVEYFKELAGVNVLVCQGPIDELLEVLDGRLAAQQHGRSLRLTDRG